MSDEVPRTHFQQLLREHGLLNDHPVAAVNGSAPYAAAQATPALPGNTHSYAAAALRSEAAEVAEHAPGGRNVRLNTAWFNMGRHIGAGSIDVETVRVELTAAARACGLPDAEIATVLRDGPTSAAAAGAANPRYPAPPTEVPEATVLPGTVEVPGDVNPGSALRNLCLDWHALWATEDEGEEWIVEPLLPARRMVALYSEPKAGKSLLVLELAVGIARGTEVLGYTPDRPRRVLYVDFENDPRGDVRARLQNMEVGPDDLDNLRYLSFPQLAKFDTAQGALDLMLHVEAEEAEVVVIDTVSRAVSGEENDNDTWLAFYRNVGLALKQAGVACLRLDHSGKDKEKGMRGGSAKVGDADAVWQLSVVGEEAVRLECTHHRMPVPDTRLTLIREADPLRHVIPNDNRAALADAQAIELDRILDSLGVPNDAVVRDVKDALKAAGYTGRVRGFGGTVIATVVSDRQHRIPGTTPTTASTTPERVPGTLREHADSALSACSRNPPLMSGFGNTQGGDPGTPSGTPSDDPDETVHCNRCGKPTTKYVADRNGGLCATCHHATGQEPPT